MFAFARNATLSRKLLAVLGVVVALMSVPVGLSLWSLLQMGTTVESMVARETEAVKLSVSVGLGVRVALEVEVDEMVRVALWVAVRVGDAVGVVVGVLLGVLLSVEEGLAVAVSL